MKRLGIIGGTFDPIHLAHVYIACEAEKKLNLDEVIFMPAGSPPHKKGKRITEASIRLKMVERAISNKKGFKVSDYEIKKQGMSYTYLTLQHFKTDNNIIYFITGADCLMDLEKWKNVNVILSLCNLVVLRRPGINDKELIKQKNYIEKKYNAKIIFLDIKGMEMSSSMIRKYVKENKDLKKYLCKDVIKIIKDEGLYGGAQS